MKKLIQAIAALGLLFVIPGLSRADIINGNFSNGLNGWTFEPSAGVNVSSGRAYLNTLGYDSGYSQISLYQTFGIPAWANTIRFDVGFSSGVADPADPGFGFPDSFTATYIDPDNYLSFLSIDVNGLYDVNGTTDPLADGMFRFSANISSLAGRTGTIYFDLLDGNDGYFSTAKVDNVDFVPVPEPGTMSLIGTGLAFLAGMRKRRGGKSL
ncbi:MAG: PEP-CTERM sorting domain-containing protein [Deltaproteobacteria bacterium]|nr:PEP-CTERM sorting domain-containing protein [Deltaproteobacteria bacterium]